MRIYYWIEYRSNGIDWKRFEQTIPTEERAKQLAEELFGVKDGIRWQIVRVTEEVIE